MVLLAASRGVVFRGGLCKDDELVRALAPMCLQVLLQLRLLGNLDTLFQQSSYGE